MKSDKRNNLADEEVRAVAVDNRVHEMQLVTFRVESEQAEIKVVSTYKETC